MKLTGRGSRQEHGSRLAAAGFLGLVLFWTQLCLPVPALAKDFRIQRGSTAIGAGNTTATATAPADFTAVASLSNALVRIVSTEGGGTGDTSWGGTSQAPREVTATAVFSDTSTIIFTRTNGTRDCRVYWEIWEYTGAAAGANEFVVRGQGTIVLNNNQSQNNAGVAGVTNMNNCVVFLTGVNHDSNSTGAYWGHSCHCYLLNANTVRLERWRNWGGQVTGSYAVVEFTGTNWTVQEGTHQFANDGVTESEPLTPAIAATDKAFLITQKMTDQNGLEDYGYQAWISAFNQVSFQLRNGADNANRHEVRYWVVENSASDFLVQRGGLSMPTADNNAQTLPVTISAVADLSNAGITFNNDCNGAGTAFPRACWIARLTDTTTLEVYRSRGGQPGDGRYEVIEFPSGSLGGVNLQMWEESY